MKELSEAHILSVRRLHDKGLSIAEIMEQTSLSNGCIRRILGVKKCIANDSEPNYYWLKPEHFKE